MSDIRDLINGLIDKNDNHAYKCLQELQSLSEQNNGIYKYFDEFVEMLDNTNSYIRTRGLPFNCSKFKFREEYYGRII